MTSLLLVLSGARVWTLRDGTPHPTGFWAEEFVAPYRIFTAAGYDITIATPGGLIPIADELSLSPDMNNGDTALIADLRDYLAHTSSVLASAVALSRINPADYDAVFVPGGHGPMQDLSVDPDMARVLAALLDRADAVVAAVCHGPASFVSARRPDGAWLFEGRQLTAFTNEEETLAGFAANAPWLLEDRLRENGAKFESGAPYAPYLVIDGNLITGQNPATAAIAANAVVDALAARV